MDMYKVAFENAPDPFLFVDEEGGILRANSEAERALGYLHDELIGRPVEDLIPFRYGDTHPRHRRNFMAAPGVRHMGKSMALFARRKDGSEFPVDVMLSPAQTPQGPIVVAILRDVTEHRRAEAQIQDLLQRHQLSAETAGMGFWTYDEAADRFVCDRVCASLFGGAPEDFPDLESQHRRVLPEDWEGRLRQVSESIRQSGSYGSEFRVLLPNGAVRWLGDLGRVTSAGDIPASGRQSRQFAGVTFDITARKESELRARNAQLRENELMENAADGIFLADLEGRYTRVNSAGCRMLGMRPEEIIGKTIMDIIPPEDVPRLADSKQDMLSGKPEVKEWRLLHKDGHLVSVEISSQIFPDGRWQAFVRDITERKELEKRQAVLITNLQNSLKEIKVLRGLLPICSHCKKIRDDSGFWQQLEVYIHDHSGADFSHSICPVCVETYYPKYAHKVDEAGSEES